MDFSGARKRLRRRRARVARSADGGKEVVQAGRQVGPGHFELTRPLVDDLVADAGAGINRRSRNEGVRHPVDEDCPLAFKAKQDLLVRRVRVLPHVTARRDYLYSHREI